MQSAGHLFGRLIDSGVGGINGREIDGVLVSMYIVYGGLMPGDSQWSCLYVVGCFVGEVWCAVVLIKVATVGSGLAVVGLVEAGVVGKRT